MCVHERVMDCLAGIQLPAPFQIHHEAPGHRIDLPNVAFLHGADPGQRQRSLCYTDVVVHDGGDLRMLVEVVHTSPRSPNGITGLTVNAERVGRIHGLKRLDMLYVVLSEMRAYYCTACRAGHRIHNHEHLVQQMHVPGAALIDLLHEGAPAAFRKALIDYPIEHFLGGAAQQVLSGPTVLFLNASRIEFAWEEYEEHVHQLLHNTITELLHGPHLFAAAIVEQSVPELFLENIPPHAN